MFIPECYRLDILADLKSFLETPTQGLWIKETINSKQDKQKKLIIKDVCELRK
jgi:hypothetical protein